ncbi:MAG: bactofilin family protein [Hyphomicrobium sp.]
MIRVTTATSVIGDDLTILGEKITIVSQNKLHVCGNVHGDIHGKQVMVSKGGLVTGTVNAENIEVRGGVRGAIRALTVTLHESAKVDADIVHQSLSISKGAEFDGRIKRANDASELMPNLDVEAVESQPGKDSDEKRHVTPANGEASQELSHPAPSDL